MELDGASELQENYLNALCHNSKGVSIYLKNGIRLQGVIDVFDKYVIVLKGISGLQLVYKHNISTVVPNEEGSFRSGSKSPEKIGD